MELFIVISPHARLKKACNHLPVGLFKNGAIKPHLRHSSLVCPLANMKSVFLILVFSLVASATNEPAKDGIRDKKRNKNTIFSN